MDFIPAVDAALLEYLQKARRGHTGDLYAAMEYAMFPGGKRIRPLVLIGACIGAGGRMENALPFACALEMVHSYSLIHDDLPAMDNDDMRRGKPSCHIRFGEATAILAGDGLLNLAYETMLAVCDDKKSIAAARTIAESAGVCGMIGGQAADMLYETEPIDADGLAFIHSGKTAALFGAAAHAGALIGGADDETAMKYRMAWQTLGIAFQIQDDIDDADTEDVKSTSVSVHGMEKSRRDMASHVLTATSILHELCGKDSFITALAGCIVKDNG